MSEELLPYYNRELAFVRRLGAEFSRSHPKIAGRLQLGPDSVEDPHVERIIEAFTYLNARIRHKLDDDFPEITDALLGVLYPHYQAPIPSMAIVQFMLDRAQGDLVGGYTIAKGAAIEAESPDGEPCRFQTNYPVRLWPIEVTSAELRGRPFSAPQVRSTGDALAVLRLKLECFSADVKFADLEGFRPRFYLKGQSQHVYALYEFLFNNTLSVALANSPSDPDPVVLKPRCVRQVGFERDQGMLPFTARSFLGYRLLTEHFTFPEKFLFFELEGPSPAALARAGKGNSLEVYFYLNQTTMDLEQNVTADTFQLGCTPMVNLYRRRAEPISMNHARTEYRVVPDARRPLAGEVYSIDRVTATSPDNEELDFQPFYSYKHAASDRQKAFWYATRRPGGQSSETGGQGTEVFLSLVDLDFSRWSANDWTLDVETTCLDRDRARLLPSGEGQPRLRLSKGAPLSRIACLTRPTVTLRPALKHGAMWRLISHLSLNHLSLVDGEDGSDALREILKLYDFADSAETRATIDGIKSVASRRVVGRSGGGVGAGFCRGLEVSVHLDETRFAGSGVFLFASVLERFLGLYCSVNSFSKLVVTTNKREGELRRWPPRAGETILV